MVQPTNKTKEKVKYGYYTDKFRSLCRSIRNRLCNNCVGNGMDMRLTLNLVIEEFFYVKIPLL